MNTQTKEPEDKLASAKAQGQAQFDSIKEMVEALKAAGENEKTIEDAEQQIHEDALSVEVRSAWAAERITRGMIGRATTLRSVTAGAPCRCASKSLPALRRLA